MAQAVFHLDQIYEREIRPLSLSDRLLLAQKIIAEAAAAARTAPSRSLLELEGLGAELWVGSDVQSYVDALRAEWAHRP